MFAAIAGFLATKGALPILGALAGPFAPMIMAFFGSDRKTVYIAISFAIGGALCGGFVVYKFWQASELSAVKATMAFAQTKVHVVTKIEQKIVTKTRIIREKGKEVIKYVPKVITQKVEAACPNGLPNGFVWLHDAAARNEPELLSGRSTVADAEPAGVTLARAGEVITDNYTEYHICKAQVDSWNEFYSCLQKSTKRSNADKCGEQATDRLKAIKALFNVTQ